MSNHETNVIIIGAGPVGLFAAFECGMLKMKVHIIDAQSEAGGQCSALYPEKPIYDIPAYPQIAAQDLVDNLVAQAAPFSPTYHFGQRVEKLERLPNGRWQVQTSKNVTITASAVLIAAGCGAFGPNRPPLEDLEKYEENNLGEGAGVFYFVRKKSEFMGKNIVIAGGGDSAVDWAIELADIAAKVQVVHRRPKFRAAPENVAKLEELAQAGKIEMVVPYQLAGLVGEAGKLSGVRVATLEGEEKTLPADALLAFFGLAMELGPIATWGLGLHLSHIEVDPATMQTSSAGVFAIGDIATYKNKLKLILCGFSEAAMAAHAIHPLVYPEQALHFEYSTSKGLGN